MMTNPTAKKSIESFLNNKIYEVKNVKGKGEGEIVIVDDGYIG